MTAILRLRKPTEIHRFTVDQQGHVAIDAQDRAEAPVVPPEAPDSDGAPLTLARRVTILVPASPRILCSLESTPTETGPNRTGYRWAPLPPDTFVVLHLQPDQQIYLTCDQDGGMATGSVIVEYPAEGA